MIGDMIAIILIALAVVCAIRLLFRAREGGGCSCGGASANAYRGTCGSRGACSSCGSCGSCGGCGYPAGCDTAVEDHPSSLPGASCCDADCTEAGKDRR